MNEMQIFKNDIFGQVRGTERDGEPWLVLKDVCAVFGEQNYRRVADRIDEEEKGVSQIATPGGMQPMTIINEAGLYSALFAMQPKKARGVDPAYIERRGKMLKAFKRWVTHEVLPSIRKHGAYATPATIDNIINDPDFGIRLLQELKAERDKSAELTAKIEADKPKVEFAEALETSTNSITVKQLSVLLAQRGCDTGEKRLFNEMREDGFLLTHGNYYNEPAQRYVDMKLFEVKTGTYTTAYGDTRNSRQTLITPKGLQYLMDYYMRKHGKMPLLSTARRKRV